MNDVDSKVESQLGSRDERKSDDPPDETALLLIDGDGWAQSSRCVNIVKVCHGGDADSLSL